MSISSGKLKHLRALSNNDGIIAAAAMDQRGSLQKSLASAKGVDTKSITPELMSEQEPIQALVAICEGAERFTLKRIPSRTPASERLCAEIQHPSARPLTSPQGRRTVSE